MEVTDVRTIKARMELDEPRELSRDREIQTRGAAVVVVGVGPEPYIVERIVNEKYAPRLAGEDQSTSSATGKRC